MILLVIIQWNEEKNWRNIDCAMIHNSTEKLDIWILLLDFGQKLTFIIDYVSLTMTNWQMDNEMSKEDTYLFLFFMNHFVYS